MCEHRMRSYTYLQSCRVQLVRFWYLMEVSRDLSIKLIQQLISRLEVPDSRQGLKAVL